MFYVLSKLKHTKISYESVTICCIEYVQCERTQRKLINVTSIMFSKFQNVLSKMSSKTSYSPKGCIFILKIGIYVVKRKSYASGHQNSKTDISLLEEWLKDLVRKFEEFDYVPDDLKEKTTAKVVVTKKSVNTARTIIF